jgi:spore maturation protein SpmA
MIWMLWCQIYLCGAVVTLVGASMAADRLTEPDVPLAARAGAIVIAGVSWPVLLVGLLQLLCIAGLAKVLSTRVSPVQSYFEP